MEFALCAMVNEIEWIMRCTQVHRVVLNCGIQCFDLLIMYDIAGKLVLIKNVA